MPRISEFFGIVISMYFNDHAPPHFHANYSEHEATISIGTSRVLEGSLPRRAMGMVLEWAALHRDELAEDWDLAQTGQSLTKIAPLEQDVFMSLLRIREVQPVEGRVVRLTLTDGSERIVDLTPFLRGPIFEPLLADDALFRAVAVDAELGTLVWPNGADLCPDVLVHGRVPASLEGAQQ